MEKFTWKRVTSYIGLVYFVPLVLSVIFKISKLGSIGPTVLIYSLISLPIFWTAWTAPKIVDTNLIPKWNDMRSVYEAEIYNRI